MISEAVNIRVLEARLQRQPQLGPEVPGDIAFSPGLDRAASKSMHEYEIDHRLQGTVQQSQTEGTTVIVLFAAFCLGGLLFREAACEALFERDPGS